MKKKFVIGLLICFCLTGCSEKQIQPPIPEYEEELIALGYQQEEIEQFKQILTEEELNKITEYDYIEILLDIIHDKDYKKENFIKYLKYYETGMKAEAIVYIINNDIKYTYNEKLVSLMNHKYFIASNLDRYMTYNSEDIEEIIRSVNVNLDRAFYTDIKRTDTTKENQMIVNKYYQLEKEYLGKNLVTMSTKYSVKSGQKINKEAYEAFKKLVAAGEKDEVYIRNLSAYRSYHTQESIYNNYIKDHGLEWTDQWSARPGHSEHQTGLALDVTVKGKSSFDNFEETKEFEWLEEHAKEYGFILRYPKDKTEITGYGYEPWHYRYVGVEVAEYITENNLTYEEYYAYFVEKDWKQ